MKNILITDLSEKVLEEIYATGWTPKYKDRYRTEGVKPIVKYFDENGLLYYDERALHAFVVQPYQNYLSGKINKSRWQSIRKCSAFMSQMVTDGHISTEPLCRWTTESIALFDEPALDQMGDLDNIHTLVYRTRQAVLNLDLSQKTKNNYTYDGFADILRFYAAKGKERYSVQLLEQLVNEIYEKYKRQEVCHSKYRSIRKMAAWVMEYHDNQTVTQKKIPITSFEYASPDFERLIQEYIDYSVSRGILKCSSIDIYSWAVRRFFREMKTENITEYAAIKLVNVSSCISAIAKKKPGDVETIFNALSSFADFIAEKHPELPNIKPALIGNPAKHKRIYEGYSEEEIHQILAAVDRSTPKGKRDYALFMIAYHTGLRGVDIVNLTFENIDWKKCEIQIVQAKTGIPLALPLEVNTGNAIAEYILEARPKCESQYIFVRMLRPYTKLADNGLWGVFSNYSIPIIGKKDRLKHGPHAFRRGMGARMLEAGVSHFVLSDVLGHNDANSFLPYASVSLNSLRQCAGTLDDIPVMQEDLI